MTWSFCPISFFLAFYFLITSVAFGATILIMIVTPDIAAALKIIKVFGKNGFMASFSLMGNGLI